MPDGTRLQIPGMEWLKDRVLQEAALDKVRQLTALAGDLGTTMPKLALAWCLKNPNVSTVILGASKVSQLEENVQALDTVALLTAEVMAQIEGILGNTPVHPQW